MKRKLVILLLLATVVFQLPAKAAKECSVDDILFNGSLPMMKNPSGVRFEKMQTPEDGSIFYYPETASGTSFIFKGCEIIPSQGCILKIYRRTLQPMLGRFTAQIQKEIPRPLLLLAKTAEVRHKSGLLFIEKTPEGQLHVFLKGQGDTTIKTQNRVITQLPPDNEVIISDYEDAVFSPSPSDIWQTKPADFSNLKPEPQKKAENDLSTDSTDGTDETK